MKKRSAQPMLMILWRRPKKPVYNMLAMIARVTRAERAMASSITWTPKALPNIRRRVAKDLKLPGLPRQKVLAVVVRLLERTFIRVGNEEYARENKSFGLTTMKNRHVTVKGARLRFRFRGKSRRQHEVDVTDRRIANIVSKCQDLPGQDLFQYVDDEGEVRNVASQDVNDYLREIR